MIVFLLDLFLIAAGSSGAVPFGTSLTPIVSELTRAACNTVASPGADRALLQARYCSS